MVSTRERKLLLGFASVVLALFVGAVALEIYLYSPIREPQPGKIAFAVHDFKIHLAGFHLMTPIIFFFLVFARNYIVSTILTSLYGLLLIASYFIRLNGEGALGGEGFYDGRKLLEIYNKSHFFDYASFVFVFIVLIWQVSILIRNFGNISMLNGTKPLP